MMRTCPILPLALLAASCVHANSAAAEESVMEGINLGGSARGAYFSASRKLDGEKNLGTGSIWLRASSSVGPDASLVADGWIRNDDIFGNGQRRSRLREGYLAFHAGDADFRIGRQIIAWGRADEINPTDNLTPRDYTLLTPETGDQRLGVDAFKASYHFHQTVLTGIWMPRFRSNAFPIAVSPGVSVLAGPPLRENQHAFKLERSGGTVDWSVSYFKGRDLNPDFRLGALSPSGVNLVLENNRVRILGMDAATVAGRYGLRMEAAYAWTASGRRGDPLAKKPHLYVVAGGDRTFLEHLNVNVQYYLRRVSDYRDPRGIEDPLTRSLAVESATISNQLDRFQHGVSFRIADKWLHEMLEGEVSGIYSLTRRDYVVRPKLIYAFSDGWKGTLGADIFRGDRDTYFGRLRKMSSVFVELKYSF